MNSTSIPLNWSINKDAQLIILKDGLLENQGTVSKIDVKDQNVEFVLESGKHISLNIESAASLDQCVALADLKISPEELQSIIFIC